MRLLATAVLVTAGCSWITVDGPPSNPQPPIECTTSQAAPHFDTTVAVVYSAAAVMGLLIANSGNDDSEFDKDVGHAIGYSFFVGGVVMAVPFYLSSRHGYSRVSACRRVKRMYEQPQPQPYPYPYQPQPYPYQPQPQPYYPPPG